MLHNPYNKPEIVDLINHKPRYKVGDKLFLTNRWLEEQLAPMPSDPIVNTKDDFAKKWGGILQASSFIEAAITQVEPTRCDEDGTYSWGYVGKSISKGVMYTHQWLACDPGAQLSQAKLWVAKNIFDVEVTAASLRARMFKATDNIDYYGPWQDVFFDLLAQEIYRKTGVKPTYCTEVSWSEGESNPYRQMHVTNQGIDHPSNYQCIFCNLKLAK
jgi:hypothetical protein